MPHMSGIETLQLLKSKSDTRDIPVIMLTAMEDKEVIMETSQAGAFDYILKDPEKIELTMERLMLAVARLPAREERELDSRPESP